MATTTGFVYLLVISPGTGTSSWGCARIGPSTTNNELLAVQRTASDSEHAGAFKNSIVDALTTALISRREVTATHASGSAIITGLSIE